MKQSLFLSILMISGMCRLSAQEHQPVTAGDLRTWCYYLAGDDMKGRKNGSPEMKEAANYIAGCFREAGLKPYSAETGYFQEYTFKGRDNKEIPERNVIGMLEGSDPVLKNEWIILSAHFDHIGIGKPVNGDSIYNGADDNATGTVTVMALAKTLASSTVRPKRSILFVAYSGEEMGLRGSRHFAGQPPVPLEQVKLNLNFEMEGESATLGRNRYILTGHQFTDFDELLDEYNKGKGWEVARNYKSPEWIFFGSDNAALAIRRDGEATTLAIPAFTLVTTDDMNFIHKVNDEPGRMDYENMESLVKYATGLVLFLSADPLAINWDHQAFDAFNKR
jgi:Zn-dependent M28 family amino/carboxypeptidase